MNKIFNWKKVTKVFISLFFLLGLFLYIKNKEISYTLTAYERELVSYFKEIALQSEYDDNPQKIIKWKEPMTLFVIKGEEFKEQISIIERTINKINQLATDGFKIVLTDELSKSNSVLYLCAKEKVAKLDPFFYTKLTDDIDYDIAGLVYSEFNIETYIIDKTSIFINPKESIDIQESTILEEITQSLGLANDSKMHPNSIFYQDKYKQEVRIKKYSQLDKDIIRLLYHPKMKPGLRSTELDIIIKEILKSENIKF